MYFLQLQEAYAKGLVKPGLNIVSVDQKKNYSNDVVSKESRIIIIN
jgi:hypothetical protein